MILAQDYHRVMDNKIGNPHDKLFRETLSDVANARDYLSNYLPGRVLDLVDLDSLEISKDSFIEKELKDYFSDILYKVNFRKTQGYIYLLFEHKSYEEQRVHVQLLGYMHKIWQLHGKQSKKMPLPVVVPLVFTTAKRNGRLKGVFHICFQIPKTSFPRIYRILSSCSTI